jgi:MFS family permease
VSPTDQGRHRALDALNFSLADVRDGLGPYLAIYLLTEQHWDEASIGVVMSIAAIAGIIAQTPAGALIDATTAKQALLIAAAAAVTLACLTLPWLHAFALVAASQAVAASAGAIVPPAIAAVTPASSGRMPWRDAPDATRRSTTPATPSPRCWRECWPTALVRSWCSG